MAAPAVNVVLAINNAADAELDVAMQALTLRMRDRDERRQNEEITIFNNVMSRLTAKWARTNVHPNKNLNTISKDAFLKLGRTTEAQWDSFVAARGGGFYSHQQLAGIRGIGEKTRLKLNVKTINGKDYHETQEQTIKSVLKSWIDKKGAYPAGPMQADEKNDSSDSSSTSSGEED